MDTCECGNELSGKNVMSCEIIVNMLVMVQNKKVVSIDSSTLSLYVMRASSAKFGLHAGNFRFSTKNKEWICTLKITRVIIHIILPVFHYTGVSIKLKNTENK